MGGNDNSQHMGITNEAEQGLMDAHGVERYWVSIHREQRWKKMNTERSWKEKIKMIKTVYFMTTKHHNAICGTLFLSRVPTEANNLQNRFFLFFPK